MDSIHKTTATICLLTVIVVSAQETCRGGSTCIKLEQCPSLQQFLGGAEGYVSDLFKGLTCGYEGVHPKVCCPPNNPQVRPQPVDSSSKLLPDTSECGIQNNDRIVGGSSTELDEHPWLALLRYDKPRGWGFYCAGVLISPRYILTAAHCVKGADLPDTWKLSQVRLGEYNVTSKQDCVQGDCSPTPLDVRIEDIIPHEGYSKFDSHQQNDIALLRLARDVPYSDFIKPICLPLTQDQRNNLFSGYDMEVAGWGKTETRSMSEIKLKVRVPVVDKNTCSNVYSKANRIITEKQMCAGGVKGEDSCRGDSGGPLMGQMPTAQNWLVVGVVSYGPTPCGTANWPGVYTRVGAFVDWILSHIH
ncbi:unnamed protein product [Parnassius apollo]|uniref:(apollo) hypothetical protein n=1 Tax=Parnassius apollo TaxID=110799 RepID=A0A8S3WCX6_PARAO|nr:unnamed protein product [Parnassius apollo]